MSLGSCCAELRSVAVRFNHSDPHLDARIFFHSMIESVTISQSKERPLLTVGIAEVGSLIPASKHGSLSGLLEVSTRGDLMSQGFREAGTNVESSTCNGASNTTELSFNGEFECTGSTSLGTTVSLDCRHNMQESHREF